MPSRHSCGEEDTAPTEGADQFEIGVTTAVNWECMDDSEKIIDLEKQTFLEIEFFLSSNVKDDQVVTNLTPLVHPPIKDNQPVVETKEKHSGVLSKITAFSNGVVHFKLTGCCKNILLFQQKIFNKGT